MCWKGKLRGRQKRRAAEALLGYVTDRRALVRYPEFQAVGRQLGSGPTASMGQATTQRIKGVGLRWAADNAAAIMVLAALEPSGAWPSYGDACLQQAA